MSWWHCFLCNRSQAVDNAGREWFEHYMGEHFRRSERELSAPQ